jgi:hypothetical protein
MILLYSVAAYRFWKVCYYITKKNISPPQEPLEATRGVPASVIILDV